MTAIDENNAIFKRINVLREAMLEQNINWLIIYTADAHMSEYLQAVDKVREYYSGFTGSAGTLLVGEESTYLWTDSRYYIQAEKELKGTGIVLMRDGLEEVPSLSDFLADHIWDGQTIGIDLKTISISDVTELKDVLPESVDIIDASRLINSNIVDRPKRVFNTASLIDETIAGKSFFEKLSYLRDKIENSYVDIEESYTYILSDLCSIMWLMNIRGQDIDYVPVAYSYVFIDRHCVTLFCNKKAMDAEVLSTLRDLDVIIKDYGTFYNELDNIASDIVLVDPKRTNALICEKIPSYVRVLECNDFVLLPKHIKNEKEIEGMRRAHILDAATMIRFIHKIKTLSNINELTEYDIGKMLDDMRLENNECEGLSFNTICAYEKNAAIVHYSAKPGNCSLISDKGMLLVDSGAHYKMGTTDITRTISLGSVSQKQKECYTAVLKANLALSRMIFPEGVRGDNLDVVARMPIWNIGYNYGHGTGHGIGCKLSVHEDPVRISYRGKSEPLSEGMVVSDEPGIYIEDEFGIRLENALLVKQLENSDFNGFETLTLVPFDRNCILIDRLTGEEIEEINEYNSRIIDNVAPLLDENDREWLMKECAIM